MSLLIFSSTVFVFLAGCGGSGGGGGGVGAGDGGENPLSPNQRIFFAHASLSGSTSVAPMSANYALGIHNIGGNFLRTESSSSNYKMISGIGVD